MAADRPSFLQYIGYSYGRRLPSSMRRWVAEDLAAQGAVRRHMMRMAIPPLFLLAPLWLLPASLYVHLEMTVPIYLWSLLMTLALNKVWRRHRLAQHGLVLQGRCPARWFSSPTAAICSRSSVQVARQTSWCSIACRSTATSAPDVGRWWSLARRSRSTRRSLQTPPRFSSPRVVASRLISTLGARLLANRVGAP